ncbi:MAG: hypothetical protein ACNYZG_04295 [Gammaproteobacteria bacterium]
MSLNNKQPAIKMLIMYVITALLFLTSIELHIHTQDTAATEEHGFAVDISSFASDLMSEGGNNEIIVSPESALKVEQSSVSLLAVFLLIAVLAAVQCRTFIGRLRESQTRIPIIPFRGVPPLRAPPL